MHFNLHIKLDKKKLFRYGALFLAGLAVLVGAEAGVLYYLNNVYLHENDHYQVTRLSSSSSQSQKHHALTLSSAAQDISVSHDGNYLAYLENGTIQIADMTSGQLTTVPAQKNRVVSYFKWVYDHDRLIIVEKNTPGSGSADDSVSSSSGTKSSRSSSSDDYFAEFYSFDMSDKSIQLVRDYMNDNDVRISLNSASDSITDMDMSTETVVTYLKITSSAGRSRLWEANITVRNAALSDLPTHNIGKIQSLKSSDGLLYEDSDTGHVYLYSAKKETSTIFSVNGQKDLRLLGFDQSDNQYFGIVQNNLVTSIAYGNPLTQTWQTISLPVPTDPAAILVAYNGTVYVNDPSAYTMKELADGKATAYTGSVAGIYDSGFYTLDSGVVTDHPVSTAASSGVSSAASGSTASGTPSAAASSSKGSISLSVASATSERYKSSSA